MKSIWLLSHPSDPLEPRPTLTILGSRIAFDSPTKIKLFGPSRNGPNRRKKERFSLAILGAKTATTREAKLLTATSRPPSSASLTIELRQHLIRKETPSAIAVSECWKNYKDVLHHPTTPCAYEVSLLHRGDIHAELRKFTKQSEYTCLDPSVPLHSNKQDLRTSFTYLPIQCSQWSWNPHRWERRWHVRNFWFFLGIAWLVSGLPTPENSQPSILTLTKRVISYFPFILRVSSHPPFSFHKSLYIKHFIWALSGSSQSKCGILVTFTCKTKYGCDYYCTNSSANVVS